MHIWHWFQWFGKVTLNQYERYEIAKVCFSFEGVCNVMLHQHWDFHRVLLSVTWIGSYLYFRQIFVSVWISACLRSFVHTRIVLCARIYLSARPLLSWKGLILSCMISLLSNFIWLYSFLRRYRWWTLSCGLKVICSIS